MSTQANAAETQSPVDAHFEAGGTLLVTRQQVRELLNVDDCIAAIEQALIEHARGHSIPPAVLGVHVDGGGFHIKTAGVKTPRPLFAAKLNGNFFANDERFGLPRIQGLVVLADGRNGYPLAVMDSTEITVVRTAAATAVAARCLARPDSATATIVGCGVQGRVQLQALCRVLPLEKVLACDREPEIARRFAADLADELDLRIATETDPAAAARRSDVVVTCTPSQSPLLGTGDIIEGTFVAAVGADSEEKQELQPALLAGATVFVDHLEQCATIGELHHALKAGVMGRSDVAAEIHEVVAGVRPGRRSPDEITLFDSTGVALQDVAAASLIFERAVESGLGTRMELL